MWPTRYRPIASSSPSGLPVAGTAFIIAWTAVRWLLTIIVIALLFSVYYFYGPNRESPRWRWVSMPEPLTNWAGARRHGGRPTLGGDAAGASGCYLTAARD
jgi:hypothetical protein